MAAYHACNEYLRRKYPNLSKGPDSKGVKAPGIVGKRVHFACVRTDTQLRLYVDGKAAGSELHPTKPAKGRIMLGGGSQAISALPSLGTPLHAATGSCENA